MLIIAAIVAAFIVVTGFLAVYQGSAKDIVAVADQFKSNPSWQQVDDQIIPPKIVCLDAECPSVHRSWKTGANLTKADFQKVLDDSNWEFGIEGECIPRPNVTSSGGQTLCSAKGEQGGYNIQVIVEGGQDDQSNGRVVLFINK